MRIPLPALALVMATPLFAQTAAQSGRESTPQTSSPAQAIAPDVQKQLQQRLERMRGQLQAGTAGCPVGFSVERKSNLNLEVAKGPDVKPTQGVDVSLGADARKIVEADITVHGMMFRPRIIGAAAGSDEDQPEEFALKGSVDNPVRLSSVWLQRLGTVSWVELTRVVYADGTMWTPVNSAHCTARPSMLVLVNSSTR